MSDVPLPEPSANWYRYEQGATGQSAFYTAVRFDVYTAGKMRAYGDARAAEARRLALDVDKVQAFERNVRADERRKALLNFQRIIEQEAEDDQTAIRMMERLLALADEASHKSVSG